MRTWMPPPTPKVMSVGGGGLTVSELLKQKKSRRKAVHHQRRRANSDVDPNGANAGGKSEESEGMALIAPKDPSETGRPGGGDGKGGTYPGGKSDSTQRSSQENLSEDWDAVGEMKNNGAGYSDEVEGEDGDGDSNGGAEASGAKVSRRTSVRPDDLYALAEPMKEKDPTPRASGHSSSGEDEANSPRQNVLWLTICFFGIMFSFVAYGLLLEYATTGGRKLHELSFLFVTSCLYTVTAAAGRYVRDETPTTIPPARFAVLGLTSMGSTFCSVRSLR